MSRCTSSSPSELPRLRHCPRRRSLTRARTARHSTSSGCGAKFECLVVSAKFDGMPLLERQRAVNNIIKEEMEKIHAFSMKCWTPEKWEKKADS